MCTIPTQNINIKFTFKPLFSRLIRRTWVMAMMQFLVHILLSSIHSYVILYTANTHTIYTINILSLTIGFWLYILFNNNNNSL